MKKSFLLMFSLGVAMTTIFISCRNNKTGVKDEIKKDTIYATSMGQPRVRSKEQINEACNAEKPITIESTHIMDKRWVYYHLRPTVFYLRNDHTCSVKDNTDNDDSQVEHIRSNWKLSGDTLIFLFTAYQNNPDADTAFYKITSLSEHKLKMNRIKRPSSSAFWVYPSGTDDTAYEQQVFLADEVYDSFNYCDVVGTWVRDSNNNYSQPYLFNFNADNSCSASGINNGPEGYKGIWRTYNNLIVMTWTKEFTGKKYSDDGYNAVLEMDSAVILKYDTIHVTKPMSYGFETKEYGLLVRSDLK